MKKFFVLFIVAMTTLLASADNYFTVSNNNRVRIHPDYVTTNTQFPLDVWAHFDGRLDHWWLEFSYPSSVSPQNVVPFFGMSVPYLQSDGTAAICTPALTVNSVNTIYSSTITTTGYWDPNNDGIYAPYGTVKWGPGDCDVMFTVSLDILSDCTGETISIDGQLTSTPDDRGNIVGGVFFYRSYTLVVGYNPGDVNGDSLGLVNMDDLTALVNYLVYDQGLNAWQLVGADVNDDGQVNMDDLTALINRLVYNQGVSQDELNEILNGGTQTS